MVDFNELNKEIENARNPKKAEILQGFFKTGKGQYGEGDVFFGITVPEQRKIAKKFESVGPEDVQRLLNSKVHEKRLISLLILIEHYKKAEDEKKKRIFDFYLRNAKKINNWDLVDLSAPKIVGDYLLDKKKDALYDLARSENLWEKRISIVSTMRFIKDGEFRDCLRISEILLGDSHDLIHKAVGWMLREIGKKDEDVLEDFLRKHYENITRTTLRYAIERFEEEKRKRFLRGEIK